MKLRSMPPARLESHASAIARRLGTTQTENRLLGGAYWTVVGTAATRGAMLVASLAIARLLGRDSFGQFGAIDSTIGMFAVFGNLGLSLSAIKFISKYQQCDRAKASRMLALCFVLSVTAGGAAMTILVAAAPWLASEALASPQLTVDLQIAALTLLLSAIQGTLNGAMLGFQAFRANGRINLFIGAATLPILVGGAVAAGIRGAVMGLVVVQAVQVVALALALRPIASDRGLRPQWHGCWSESGELLRFSLAALLNSLLVAPVNWILVIMIVRYGGGFGELGLFQVANNWFLVLLFLPGRLSQVYYPIIEDLLARGESRPARLLVLKLVRTNVAAFGALAVIGTLASNVILQWYGSEFLAARPTLILTLWTAVCVAASQPLTALVFAHSRMWQVTLCSLCWAAISLVTFARLLDYGASGATTARLLAYATYGILMAAISFRLLSERGDDSAAASIASPWLEPATVRN